MRVVLPTPGGPWTTTTKGGGSSGVVSTTGTAITTYYIASVGKQGNAEVESVGTQMRPL